jgi:glycosyltransferase involved in cell wall biosynthesis
MEMKVLIVGSGVIEIPPKGYGAVEKHIWNLSQSLKKLNHDVTILNELFGYGIFNRYQFANWVKKQIKNLDYDVIHAHTTSIGSFFRLFGIHFIYTSHSRHWVSPKTAREKITLKLEKRAVKKADKVIAVSPQIAKLMKKYCKPNIIPNGVDVNLYKPNYDDRNGKNVIGIGELAPHKKFDLIIKATQDLDCHVTLIGPSRNPNYTGYLRKLGGNKLTIMGEIDEQKMIDVISKSDIIVHPSISDSFGMVIVEGMSCGLPVIASDICEKMVTDNLNGFTIPTKMEDKKRIQIIRDKLLVLLKDKPLRQRMSENSRKIVKEYYSWEKIAFMVADVYEESLNDLS